MLDPVHGVEALAGSGSGNSQEGTGFARADEFILELYRGVHEREPDATEVAAWSRQLLLGLPPAQIRQEFLNSTEYQEKLKHDAVRRAIAETGLFDAGWYLRRYADVAAAGLDGLKHYTQHGWREDRGPNAYFDAAWYRRMRASAVADENPLLDYARNAEPAGLPPGPHFDPAWYRRAYGLNGTASPLADFLARRQTGTVAPSARLWSVLGLPKPESDATNADPFERFLRALPETAASPSADNRLLREAALFDLNYYAVHSSDVMEAGLDPLDHFCEFGWKEGRHPNFYFSVSWYRATNPEASRLAVNPLVHYLLVGEPAGRRPIVYFDPIWYRQTYDIAPYTSPLAHYLAHRRTQKFSPHPLFDPGWYIEHSRDGVYPRRDPFSHFLAAGMYGDVPPSAAFDPAAWRRRTRGRPTRGFKSHMSPERDNPLINYLLATYM